MWLQRQQIIMQSSKKQSSRIAGMAPPHWIAVVSVLFLCCSSSRLTSAQGKFSLLDDSLDGKHTKNTTLRDERSKHDSCSHYLFIPSLGYGLPPSMQQTKNKQQMEFHQHVCKRSPLYRTVCPFPCSPKLTNYRAMQKGFIRKFLKL